MTRVDSMLLPDPALRDRIYPIISVDDHLNEPRHTFEGRMPEKYADSAPTMVRSDSGGDVWLYENTEMADNGLCNIVGRDQESWSTEPISLEEVRPGTWDINERVKDMDIDGVYAHVCFPSGAFGFGGRVFPMSKDQELGLASMRAYNDWHLEELAGAHPGRIIPMQLVWFTDPEIGAAEIRRNSERGFKAATFPDLPHKLLSTLPRIADPYWTPILQALEETETAVCLHLGSAAWTLSPIDMGKERYSSETPELTVPALFSASSMVAAHEWIFSGVPSKFPDLKICMSEGGIGWVPMTIDRLDYIRSHSGAAMSQHWKYDETPTEVLLNHFYFCMLDNPSSISAYELIGSDHIMVESDYPHSDSTWPDTQKLLADRFVNVEREAALNMSYRTAEKVFRHTVPSSWLQTTEIH